MGCRDCPKKKRVTSLTVSGTRRVVMRIEGMNCDHCVLAVRSILEGAGDFKDIHVEYGLASFQAPRIRPLEDVMSAIRELGYRIEAVR